MAVCAYILDKNDNLLLTKRPDWLKIFPNVWVMPGGIVEYQERMDIGLFREIEEEIGLTFEYVDDKNPDENVKMTSPLRFDHPSDEIEANMKPFYLYESVTRHLFDQNDLNQLPGYQQTPIEKEEFEQRPPPSQHLCLFYKIKIDETFERILIEMNKAEVQVLAWASLPQLAEAFKGNHSKLQHAYEYDPSIFMHEKSNCVVNSDRLWPLFEENLYSEGLAKGHWLAINHLLRTEGFKV